MPRNKGGRPPFEPTKAQRVLAKEWAIAGIPHERIAAAIKIDNDTLQKYFKDELTIGRDEAIVDIAKTLVELGRGGNATALIFWLKTRAGWKEESDIVQAPAETHLHFHSTPKPERYNVQAPEEKDGTKDE